MLSLLTNLFIYFKVYYTRYIKERKSWEGEKTKRESMREVVCEEMEG